MLMKANGPDEIDKALTTWRALTPHWNTEADRIRTLLQGEGAAMVSVSELERLSEMMRQTIAAAERLLSSCPAGDTRFADLLMAIGECQSLLESYQTSLDRLEPDTSMPQQVPIRLIVHREGQTA